MKKIFLLLMPAAIIFAGCGKENSKPDENPSSSDYINTISGSTWTYKTVETSDGETYTDTYTVTSTNRDTTINNRKYHIYSRSFGENSYLAKSGADYYAFEAEEEMDLANNIERLYLKSNVEKGGSWTQSVTLNIDGLEVPVKLINKIADKDITREVEGKTYDKVIHVTTDIVVEQFPIQLNTNIESFYAPNFGMIESNNEVSVDFMGESIHVKLKTTLSQSQLK